MKIEKTSHFTLKAQLLIQHSANFNRLPPNYNTELQGPFLILQATIDYILCKPPLAETTATQKAQGNHLKWCLPLLQSQPPPYLAASSQTLQVAIPVGACKPTGSRCLRESCACVGGVPWVSVCVRVHAPHIIMMRVSSEIKGEKEEREGRIQTLET